MQRSWPNHSRKTSHSDLCPQNCIESQYRAQDADKMPLEVLPLEEADLPTFYDILWEAGREDIISSRMYPNGYSQASRDWSVSGSADDLRNDADTNKYMKVIDTDLPEDDAYRKILGIAKWQVYARDRTDEELKAEEKKAKEKGMPPGANAAFLEDFFGGVDKRKTEIIGNKAFVYLALLFTHPDRFRRGAGTMHLQWGLGLADKVGTSGCSFCRAIANLDDFVF